MPASWFANLCLSNKKRTVTNFIRKPGPSAYSRSPRGGNPLFVALRKNGGSKESRQNWKAVAPPPISREANSRSLVRCLIARIEKEKSEFLLFFLEFVFLVSFFAILLALSALRISEAAKIFNAAKTEMKGKRNFTQLFLHKERTWEESDRSMLHISHSTKKKTDRTSFLPFPPFHKLFIPPPAFQESGRAGFFGGHVHCSTKKRGTKNRKREPLARGRRGLMVFLKKPGISVFSSFVCYLIFLACFALLLCFF